MEAGSDYQSEETTPNDLLDSKIVGGADHDWGYTAIPVEGRTVPYQRGKVMGGTSAINAVAALWARPDDFETWVELGNTGWGWQDVVPYFQRLEADVSGAGSHHGRNGPVSIERYDEAEFIPIQRAFYEACLTIRLNSVVDRLIFNDGHARGVRLINGSIQDAESVTLCAGAIGSPAILMRSGIGAKHDLEVQGIKSTIDLPGVS